MEGLLNGIMAFTAADEAAPGAALAVVGGACWILSLGVGWATPPPLIGSVGRAAVAASGCSMLALLAGLVAVIASIAF